jgi:hypothetical protein
LVEAIMRRCAALALGLILAAPVVWGGELAGVTMSDTVNVGESELSLNGMGLRKKSIIKVYVAGLYVAETGLDAQKIVASKSPKRVVMHFLTGKATKKKMDAAWQEGFEANSPDSYGALEERVRRFVDFFGDMKKGDVIQLTIVPGSGTQVALNGEAKGTIDGDDFGRALLLVWLGDQPPSDGLKQGLLGT